MFIEIQRSIRFVFISVFVCVCLYSSFVLGIASVAVPAKRLGSLIQNAQGRIVGSSLLAQSFERPEYLWPRPSAANYNAAGAGGSNLSPASSKIRERAEGIIQKYALAKTEFLPSDLVLASGSGLDPHITYSAAMVQAERIAMSRQVDVSKVRKLLEDRSNTPKRFAGSEHELINVLEFNLMLDSTFSTPSTNIVGQ